PVRDHAVLRELPPHRQRGAVARADHATARLRHRARRRDAAAHLLHEAPGPWPVRRARRGVTAAADLTGGAAPASARDVAWPRGNASVCSAALAVTSARRWPPGCVTWASSSTS